MSTPATRFARIVSTIVGTVLLSTVCVAGAVAPAHTTPTPVSQSPLA
ncbi:hypothetical protein [Sphingomonas sp.]|nr:hypothetical protein [Sphingomonas sp.]HWK36161.1 hypothetical protein [Sphingomonas sp.]